MLQFKGDSKLPNMRMIKYCKIGQIDINVGLIDS